MDNLKTTPTVQLVNKIAETEDQSEINAIAYELACRIYVPNNSQTTFEQMLTNFGYKEVKKLVLK